MHLLTRRALTLSLVALAACSGSDDDTTNAHEHEDPSTAAPDRALSAEVDALKQKLAEIERKIAASDTEAVRSALQAELDKAKAALAAAEKQLAENDVDAFQESLAAARAALTALLAAWDALPGTVTLEAKFAFGEQGFELDTPYELASGRTVSFSEVRYWLTNVKLTGAAPFAVPDAYYLYEVVGAQALANGTQKATTLPANRRESTAIGGIPNGTYTGIEFSVGVDAEHNDNLALPGGELNVLKNMTSFSWMWFTSYIFTKVTGSVVVGAAEPALFGWETGTNANYRTVTKAFTRPIQVAAGARAKVSLKVDVAKLLGSLDPAALATVNASTPAERDALADDWAGAFTLVGATSAAP